MIDISYAQARRFGALAITQGQDVPIVVLREDADPQVLLEMRRLLGRSFAVERRTRRAFDDLLSERYGAGGLDAGAVAADLDGQAGADFRGDIPEAADLLDSEDEAPVINFINRLIAEAAVRGASDIHIEPYESAILVRMRVDGILQELARLPARVGPMIVSRIKVMARLDIAERRVPQDGRISVTRGGKALDVRVSTLPARSGERVVLRILDRDQADIQLQDMGMPPAVLERLTGALREPNGIILVTGPTGSGKTTTLYAGLRLLNDGARNVLTVEDPVEYAIDGIGQTQVNTKVGMTFATGLRAILRQDPDVVMVGEIRDFETAETAIQASLTGHLVLSTVHTNDAIGAIVRLRDLGVEPFLLASALRLVLAQRLVRRLCPSCRVEQPALPEVARRLGLPAQSRLFSSAPSGCPTCKGTGYQGRIGVFEAVPVDDDVRRLILAGASEDELAAHAYGKSSSASQGLRAAAARLVAEGQTTAEEALRVSRASATTGSAADTNHAAL